MLNAPFTRSIDSLLSIQFIMIPVRDVDTNSSWRKVLRPSDTLAAEKYFSDAHVVRKMI